MVAPDATVDRLRALLDLAVRGILDPGGEEPFKTFVVALAEWRARQPAPPEISQS